jgi:hypothetical protein
MFGAIVPVGASLVALLAALLWLTSPSYSDDEPRPIPHYIPILGHAISFARNRREFLEKSE